MDGGAGQRQVPVRQGQGSPDAGAGASAQLQRIQQRAIAATACAQLPDQKPSGDLLERPTARSGVSRVVRQGFHRRGLFGGMGNARQHFGRFGRVEATPAGRVRRKGTRYLLCLVARGKKKMFLIIIRQN